MKFLIQAFFEYSGFFSFRNSALVSFSFFSDTECGFFSSFPTKTSDGKTETPLLQFSRSHFGKVSQLGRKPSLHASVSKIAYRTMRNLRGVIYVCSSKYQRELRGLRPSRLDFIITLQHTLLGSFIIRPGR